MDTRVQNLSNHLVQKSGDVLYVANRGIPALRIIRTAKRLGYRVVGGYCKSDAKEHFVSKLDEALLLDEKEDGPAAYMNIDNVIRLAIKLNAMYVHPGIGLLSENADFARACEKAHLIFVGPSPTVLDLFGNKLSTCQLAEKLNIPTLSLGKVEPSGVLSQSQRSNLPILFKATNGGGGLGLRILDNPEKAKEMYERCSSEAARAFGENNEICAEIFLRKARHVECQLVGDGQDTYFTLSDRECTIQRKFQKMIEMAPCPSLNLKTRNALHECAIKIARHVQYKGVGTFEFLVNQEDETKFYFIECNPRLQVEHTVTEQIFKGLDIVECQLKIAKGIKVSPTQFHQQLDQFAIQCRINAERYAGNVILPGSNNSRISTINFPYGSGIRFETICASSGYLPNSKFDNLLMQMICTDSDFEKCCKKVSASLQDLQIEGCPTNINLLKLIFQNENFLQNKVTTLFFDENIVELLKSLPKEIEEEDVSGSELSPGISQVTSPLQGTVISLQVKQGDLVIKNETVICVISALKMEHEIRSNETGRVERIFITQNQQIQEKEKIAFINTASLDKVTSEEVSKRMSSNKNNIFVPSEVYKQFLNRVEYHTLDSSRPDKTNKRLQDPTRLTARNMLKEIFDDINDTIEYGRLATNGFQKHSVGDGLYIMKGLINHKELIPEKPKALVLAYDYTVLAGTQGVIGHKKKDRAFEMAMKEKLPTVLFAEGGGGRAGSNGGFTGSGLDGPAFTLFAKLSAGNIPLVGALSGFCFAGNAALLAMCDVIVSSTNASLAMGGPAMIEGGGLGIVQPEDVGPAQMHFERGSIDVLVNNDLELVAATKKVLSYFQGPIKNWKKVDANDAQVLRNLVPTKNRRLAFNIHVGIEKIFDTESILELKAGFAKNAITCLARLEGRPCGVVANDCRFVSGALDADASWKIGQFFTLCNKHNLPIVVLCDTPGFLVGVESEKQSLVKRAGELYIIGASMKVPVIVVVVRKLVGLGGTAMTCGDLKVPRLTVAWPTGEFGAMGFEGAVRLGFRNEIKDNPVMFENLVQKHYENGKALRVADNYEIDDVIDPADTRKIVTKALFFASSL